MSILDLFDSILDLGVYIWASRYRLCPDFGALQFKIGPLRVDFVLSGLKFGPLRVDFWRSGKFGTQFGTPGSQFFVQFGIFDSISDLLDSILGLGGINCRPLGFDFRTWGYNLGPPGIDFVPILGLYSSRLDL